ncbi:MAG: sulfotransferase [Rhodothermales bacterium]|nr:sulfotransferase [Rhodothermales bacterium]MBO6781035.1 sulfotransferase [Rhodothermales bacterium]
MTKRQRTTPNPVVIIGAGRSGTNMLRDAVTRAASNVGTWPCDEINYIWRHGNASHPTDELRRHHARPEVKKYIVGRFEQLRQQANWFAVVEKTCANSLRVPFVDEVLPNARFVCIERNGMDVVNSALKRWSAPVDWRYLARKARFVPAADVPYYGSRYLMNRCSKVFGGKSRLSSWGPRFPGMDLALEEQPLAAVCALQWRACVQAARRDLALLDSGRSVTVQYEDFVVDPVRWLGIITEFLGESVSQRRLEEIATTVSTSSVGRWKSELSSEDVRHIKSIV